MTTYQQGSATMSVPAIGVGVGERSTFIVRTYNHLFGAIVLFTLLEISGIFPSEALAQAINETKLGAKLDPERLIAATASLLGNATA